MERVDWNRHHTLWTRKAHQREHFNRLLRNHPGMIIPLPVPVHRDLHAEVKPPIVPSRHLADTLVHHLNTLNPINAFSGVLSLLDVIVEQDNSMSEQAYQLAHNFKEQAEVMAVIYPPN